VSTAAETVSGNTSTQGSNRHWMHTLSGSAGGPSQSQSPALTVACPVTFSSLT
jgi:hypothetical protein